MLHNLALNNRLSSCRENQWALREKLSDHFPKVALCLVFLAVCPLFGQGTGTPAGTGFVPNFDTAHRQAGVFNTLELADLSPFSMFLAVAAPNVSLFPLAGLGLGPAVLAPDLNSPFGTLLIPNLIADHLGRRFLGFNVPTNLTGMTFYTQFLAVDAAAPFGGFAVSESRGLIFGPDRESSVVATPVSPLHFALSERFSNGVSAAPDDLRLSDVRFLPLTLANSNEMAAGREDTAVVDPFADVARHIRLVDGSSLFLVNSSTNESGLIRVSQKNRLEVLAWAQGAVANGAFAPQLAVSSFAGFPYAALVAEQALPEYGNRSLLIVRTDGRSIPGATGRAIGISTPLGANICSGSLCFLNGALYFGDGESVLFRLDLSTWALTLVSFPPSGGMVPIYVDEGCAVAENGSLLAIGAGVDDENHDVYCITSAGVVTNLTNFPADYEDAGAGESDGIQLAVDATGSRVAYMRTVLENEAFVRDTTAPFLERHVTNPAHFIDSIDTVVGLGLSAGPDLVFLAGNAENQTDLYTAPVATGTPGGPVPIVNNVTQTSPTPVAPFGLGATLALDRRFTHGPVVFSTLASGGVVQRVQAVGLSVTLNLPLSGLLRVYPLTSGVVFVDAPASGVRVRVVGVVAGNPVLGASFQTAGSATLLAAAQRSGGSDVGLLIGPATSSTLVRVDPLGNISTAQGPAGTVTPTLAAESQGRFLLHSLVGGSSLCVHRYDPNLGAVLLLGTTTLNSSVRFLK